nr:protein C19orf12 homolog isoform X2 [Cherax quadricarinatus]
MPLNTKEVLHLVEQLCEEKQLRVAVRESVKGGMLAGGTTLIGGLLGGPFGLALGGAVGGLTAAYLSQGKFKSVVSIIRHDLTAAQRQRLANSVHMFLQSWSIKDVAEASRLLLSPTAKAILLQIALQFVIAAVGIIFRKSQEKRKVKRLESSPSSSRI